MSERSNIDLLCSSLQAFRDARIRQRKGAVAEKFLLARKTVRDMYREYSPEDLPIDVNRVSRDIDIERDLTIDEECDAINDDFKITVGILRLVAEKHPELYEQVAAEVGDDRSGWRQQRRRSRRPPTTALPMEVLAVLSTQLQNKVIDTILDSSDGVTFRDLCAIVWPDGVMGGHRKVMRTFLRFLKDGGHIRDSGGNTSSMKYLPGPTLEVLSKMYNGDNS